MLEPSMRLGPLLLYAATAAGLGLLFRTLWVGPVPLPWALGAFLGYLALVLAGVFFPTLQMWGAVLLRVHRGRGVALTFDDGPHPEYTLKVLDILDQHHAKATFFVIGEKVDRYPDTVREIVRRGHDIGSHGYRIDRWLSLRALPAVRADLRRSVQAIERATGERPRFFRPPYGLLNPRFTRVAEELGLLIVGWSARALDGVAWTSAPRAAQHVIAGLREGAIVCMHDAAEDGDRRPVILDALPGILRSADALQLNPETLSALLASSSNRPKRACLARLIELRPVLYRHK